MADEMSTRDRVRALVREVLEAAGPAEESGQQAPQATPAAQGTSPAGGAPSGRARVVDVAAQAPPAPPERDYTHDESSKTIITERDVSGLPEGARLRLAEGARLTPLAADIIRERGVQIVRRQSRGGSGTSKTVAVGADHGGYPMKEELKAFLGELGHRVRDFGTNSKEAVDYPDFAHAVARAVSEGEAEVGICIDGAGVGSAMTANKVPGVRAAACYSVRVAVNSREHNGANVLTLGSGTINSQEMRDIVRAWLSADITEDRHKKRVAKIEAVERQYKA